jgi:hypothetical protein
VLPFALSAQQVQAGYYHRVADETNTFGPDDTLEVRLCKFNELTGMDLTLSGPDRTKRRKLVYPDGRTTGLMNEETMMHWTAQVGFGYRWAKAQG